MAFRVPEKFRVRDGRMGSNEQFGCNGAFDVPLKHGQRVFVIASDQLGWEHVSVSRRDRAPLWDEMCQVKALFWEEDDCVVQFHPPRSDYVNQHPNCLHLWRFVDGSIPRPPTVLVGFN